MKIEGKKILVIGLGKTGIASARFLLARGADVYWHDDNPQALADGIEGARMLEGKIPVVDFVVPSPGVPPSHPLLVEAAQSGRLIISELELAFAFAKMPIVAITGTNGKTTTTSLVGEMLISGGKKVFVGGNIGSPFIECVGGDQIVDYAILEISSFQLLHTKNFRANIALLLNITRDHTDYHGSMEEYAKAKGRIFANQKREDVAIVNADDEYISALIAECAAAKLFFSSSKAVDNGMCLGGEVLIRYIEGKETRHYDVSSLSLKGGHNMENTMAAILAAEACGIDDNTICHALSSFRPAPHRIEFVAEHDGVEFYDDSKGTNVDAALRALQAFTKPVILLMGGHDKEGDFLRMVPLMRNKVRLLILFGEARNTIAASLEGRAARTLIVSRMQDATIAACREAKNGEVVLLSPGCASFDEFSNYAERGNVFKKIVREFINA